MNKIVYFYIANVTKNFEPVFLDTGRIWTFLTLSDDYLRKLILRGKQKKKKKKLKYKITKLLPIFYGRNNYNLLIELFEYKRVIFLRNATGEFVCSVILKSQQKRLSS